MIMVVVVCVPHNCQRLSTINFSIVEDFSWWDYEGREKNQVLDGDAVIRKLKNLLTRQWQRQPETTCISSSSTLKPSIWSACDCEFARKVLFLKSVNNRVCQQN